MPPQTPKQKVFILLHEGKHIVIAKAWVRDFVNFDEADSYVWSYQLESVPLNSYDAAVIRDSYRNRGWKV